MRNGKWLNLVGKFATSASGAIWWSNLQIMQVAPSGGQIWNLCKWCHLVTIFATNASGAIWWPILQLSKWRQLVAKFVTNVSGAILLPSSIQVTESISGSVVPLAMFFGCLPLHPKSYGDCCLFLLSRGDVWKFKMDQRAWRIVWLEIMYAIDITFLPSAPMAQNVLLWFTT